MTETVDEVACGPDEIDEAVEVARGPDEIDEAVEVARGPDEIDEAVEVACGPDEIDEAVEVPSPMDSTGEAGGGPVALAEINDALGGPPLSVGEAAAFETAWREFSGRSGLRDQQSADQIEELTRLLTVSEANLEEVRGQGWFKRSWATVSGRNRRLATINQANLAKVQKGTFYFFDGLAQQSQTMMRAVHFALGRVEDSQILNERLKGHLLHAVERYNTRLRALESRQDALEERLLVVESESFAQVASSWPWVLSASLLLVGGLALAASGNVLGLAGSEGEPLASPLTAGAIGSTLLSFVFLGRGIVLRRRAKRGRLTAGWGPEGSTLLPAPTTARQRRVQAKNARFRSTFASGLTVRLTERYVERARVVAWAGVQEILDAKAALRDSARTGSKQDRVSATGELLHLSGDLRPAFGVGCSAAAAEIREDFNHLLYATVARYAPDEPGISLAGEMESRDQTKLQGDLVRALAPFDEAVLSHEALRRDLLVRFPRWATVSSEGFAYSLGKELLKGFLIVPALIDDQEEFMKAFASDLDRLAERWDFLASASRAAAEQHAPLVIQTLVPQLLERWGPVLDALDRRAVPLSKVSESILSGLE